MISWLKRTQLLRWLPDAVVLTRMPRQDKALYLTFDDGPDPRYTSALLDLLRSHGAHATFFLIGRQAERHPQLVERIITEGHRLGNHSYSHPKFNGLSLAEKMAEIDRTDQLLAAFDGIPHHSVRPPSGAFSWVLTMHLARHRRKLAYWSYDSLDYQHRSPEDLVELMRRQPPCAGDIVLMHDDSDCCIQMLATLLPEWRAGGFSFSALPA
jgi:peptidoglycan-N-acetylglucosamine deacetylase